MGQGVQGKRASTPAGAAWREGDDGDDGLETAKAKLGGGEGGDRNGLAGVAVTRRDFWRGRP